MEYLSKNKNVRFILGIVLFIFALFGFIEALFSISSALKDDKASLQAHVYPVKPMVPYFFEKSIGVGFKDNEASFIEILSENCNERKDLDTKRKQYCEHVSALKILTKKTTEAYTFNGTVFDIELENSGSTRAVGIQISGSNIEFLDAYANGGRLNTPYNSENKTYKIPDINPGDKIKIEVWKKGNLYIHDTIYDFEVPRIFFDGPPIKIVLYQMVKQSYWDYAKIFFDAGPIFGTLIFICGGFILGLGILLLIVVLNGLLRGQSFKEIFDVETKATG